MATLSDIRDRVYRILADPERGLYTPDLVDDGIKAALEAILPWVFKRDSIVLTADEEAVSFELPEDLYRITAVFSADDGVYLKEDILSAGQAPGSDLESNQDWMEYPEGYINLANAPTEDVTVYYAACWEVPVEDDDVIEAPVWTHRALVFYAASYALLNAASSSANIRQWNVTVDSGTPVMNPMRDMSTYYLERFRIEMERMPSRIRGVHG
jgi:hypothetical protein